MRSGAAADHRGYFHETVFYGSDDEFLGTVVPFLREGLEAGEPTFAALSETNEKLVRAATADMPGIAFLPGAIHARPASAIKEYRELLAGQVAAGATQIRIVGDVPHPGLGMPWDWWARYEAAANVAYADFPAWGLCPYDTRITPDEVLADVERTHPRVATPDGQHLDNNRYEEPASFLRRAFTRNELVEPAPPRIELLDPSPAAARHAVLDAAAVARLGRGDVDGMVVAVSEAVTNAITHGRPPVHVRVWAAAARMVVTVTDRGDGPQDPFAGLLPAPDRPFGGLGLWLAHQLCSHVALGTGPDGFTVRLVAGDPGTPPAWSG